MAWEWQKDENGKYTGERVLVVSLSSDTDEEPSKRIAANIRHSEAAYQSAGNSPKHLEQLRNMTFQRLLKAYLSYCRNHDACYEDIDEKAMDILHAVEHLLKKIIEDDEMCEVFYFDEQKEP
jgi:hypothetical protein